MCNLAGHSLKNQHAAVEKADGMESLQFVAVAAACRVVGVACHGLVVVSAVEYHGVVPASDVAYHGVVVAAAAVMAVVCETRGDPWQQPTPAPLYLQYQGYLVVLMTVVEPTTANCVACSLDCYSWAVVVAVGSS